MDSPAVRPMTRQEIERRAVQILQQHRLYSIPVDPVVLANREGIEVRNALFSKASIAGMITKRGSNVMLLINQSDPSYRKRFTIAHELGHHFLHLLTDGEFIDEGADADLFRDIELEDEDISEAKRKEIQANQFAAALLMPAEFARKFYKDTQDILTIARVFNVSESAMAIRLNWLRLY